MKNTVLLIISLIISLIICETVLRMFTPFPISEESNKSEDPVLGYRLNIDLDDVDQNGFRNPYPRDSYDIAVIGDSFAYGVNVTSEHSWPSLLSKKTGNKVYNFGVGSYGIYTYHAILKTLINPDAKGVIIGIYPANDFAMIASFCHIKFNSLFWQNEIDRLDLKLYSKDAYRKHCAQKTVNNVFKRFKKYIYNNTAIINAINILIVEKIKTNRDRKNKDYIIHSQSVTVKVPKARTRFGAKNTDMKNQDYLFMHADFIKFVKDWGKWAAENNKKIGILLIPSMERVVYEYIKRNNQINLLDKDFIGDLEIQINFDNYLSELFYSYNIPHKFALNYTHDVFMELSENGKHLYPDNDIHPHIDGYQAFAFAAKELWQEMNSK